MGTPRPRQSEAVQQEDCQVGHSALQLGGGQGYGQPAVCSFQPPAVCSSAAVLIDSRAADSPDVSAWQHISTAQHFGWWLSDIRWCVLILRATCLTGKSPPLPHACRPYRASRSRRWNTSRPCYDLVLSTCVFGQPGYLGADWAEGLLLGVLI